jgi:hypothetical protein
VCLWAPIGVPDARWCPKERPLGYVNRKPGPAPWGLPPPGPASAPLGGRAWPRALPRQREGGLPGGGVGDYGAVNALAESADGRMPAGSGSPGGWAGLEGHTPAAPGLKGGRGPAYRTSHGGHGLSVAARPGRTGPATAVPRPKWGAAPGEAPGTAPAKQGRVWWFVVARTARRPAVGIRGEKPRARSPLYKTRVRPPAAQPPGPTGPGAFFLSAAS